MCVCVGVCAFICICVCVCVCVYCEFYCMGKTKKLFGNLVSKRSTEFLNIHEKF